MLSRRFSPGLLIACGLLCGCATPRSQAPTPTSHAAAPAKIAFPPDDLGRAVGLKTPAQRVIVVGPGATESLFAIGAGGQIVGRDGASDFPAAAKNIAVAGDFNGPNVEQCVALRPDLVVVQGESYGAARADDWQRKIGVPVAVLSAKTVAGVADEIRKLGQWTGHDKGRSINAEAVRARFLLQSHGDISKTNPARVFFEVGRDPLFTAGRGTLINDVLKAADLRNVAAVNGYAPYSTEALVANSPDFYIVTYEGGQQNAAQAKQQISALRRHPLLGRLKCVRAGKVVALPADWLLRPSPRLVKGRKALSRAIHPEY